MLRHLALTLLLLGPVSSINLSAKSFHAERFDVQAELLPDRSLKVEESVVFVFRGGEFTKVWREIPTRYTDGLVDVVARLDGAVLPAGTAPGQVEIGRGSKVKVTWHFAPTRGTHAFTLSYRLLGVATRGERHDQIDWIALPNEHGYQVDAARVTLRVPTGAALASTADVRPRKGEVLEGPDGVTVMAGRIDSDSTIRITLGIAHGALAPAMPRWQAEGSERSRRGPWLLLVAGAILAAGLGWLAAFSSGWSQPRRGDRTRHAVTTPPGLDLPAAAAARLAGRGGGLQKFTATLLELASRGVVRFEEHPAKASRMFGRHFDVVLIAMPASPPPHEAAALALAFGSSPRAGARTTWRRLQQDVNNKGTRFSSALLETMRRHGYVDPDRVVARKTLVRVLVFCGALVLVSLAVAAVVSRSFGAWGFVVPAALALVTIAFGIAVGRFSVLTTRGEADAHAWRGFFAHLDGAVSPKGPSAALPPSWLTMAVAIGVGHHAIKRMAGAPLPPWFRAAATGSSEGHESFAALIATAGASGGTGDDGGGASAAASAAGAAGGGSSGAS
jgi:hypothetical protein